MKKEGKAGIAIRAVQNALTRMGGKIAEDVQREFSEQREREAKDLYGAFVEAINNRKPSVETVLYVLRQMEFTMLLDRHNKIVAAPADDAAPVLAPGPEK